MKRISSLVFVFGLLLESLGSALEQGNESCGPSYATIQGKALVQYGLQMYPAGNTPVYLFTLEESAKVRKLEQEAYRRSHKPGITQDQASEIVGKLLNTLDGMIPKMPRTAMTRTNRKGVYRFENVAPGKRYHVIAFGQWEDGNYIAARITPLVKPGVKLHLDLRDDTPWEDQFVVK